MYASELILLAQRSLQKRRCKIIRSLIKDILFFRKDGKPYTFITWLAILVLVKLLMELKNPDIAYLSSLILFSILSYLSLFDIKYYIIPNQAIYCLVLCGIMSTAIIAPSILLERILSAFICYGSMSILSWLYEYMRGFQGLGTGDIKLIGTSALWLDLINIPGCIFVATASAMISILIATQIHEKQKQSAPIPFGPHLAFAIWSTWALGPIELG